MILPLAFAASLHWLPLGEPGCGGAMTGLAISPHEPKRVLVSGDMLGIGLSLDGAGSWGAALGLKSYEIAAATFHPTDPKVVWVGTMGGPHLSLDGGKTWTSRRAGMPEPSGWSYTAPVEKVLFDPNDPRRLVAVGGSSRRWEANSGAPAWGAVWESRDGGAQWAKIGAIEDPKVKGDNKGAGRNIVAAAFAPRSSKRLFALVNDAGFWRSDDGGARWTRLGKGISGPNVQRLAVHPTRPDTLWVSTGPWREGAGDYHPGGVWESRDAGATFRPIVNGLSQASSGGPMQTAGYYGFAVSAKDPRFMVVADGAWNTGVLYVTRDGGANWKPVATKGNVGHSDGSGSIPKVETAMPAGLAAGEIAIDGDLVLACNSEWIVKSGDGGKTWADASSRKVGDGWAGRGYAGWCSRQVRFDPVKKGRVMLQAMDAGRAWVSADGMKSWRYGDGFAYPWGCGADGAWAGGDRVYGAYGQFNSFGGVGRSDDAARTWAVLAGRDHGLPENGAGGSDPYGLYAEGDRVWTVLGGELYASADGAKTFVKALSGRKLGSLTGAKGRVFVSGETGVLELKGAEWEPIGGPRPAARMDLDREGRLYVCSPEGERSGLWRYEKGKWARLLDERYATAVAVDPKDPARLVVATGEDPYMDFSPVVGTLVSNDAGASWSLQNEGLAVLRASCVAFDPFSDAVVLGTYGRGFFRAAWPVATKLVGTTRYASTSEDAAFARTPAP